MLDKISAQFVEFINAIYSYYIHAKNTIVNNNDNNSNKKTTYRHIFIFIFNIYIYTIYIYIRQNCNVILFCIVLKYKLYLRIIQSKLCHFI